MDEDMSPMMPDPDEQRLLGLSYTALRAWWAAMVREQVGRPIPANEDREGP
jgi:hypothetical protein